MAQETIDQQRQAALEKANAVRVQRAQEKQALSNGGGRKRAAQLLIEVPSYWETASVDQLLRSVRGIGRVKAGLICRTIGVSPSKKLNQLSAGTRGRLIEQIVR